MTGLPNMAATLTRPTLADRYPQARLARVSLGCLIALAATAGAPAADPPPPAQAAPAATTPPPDESLFEFLGSDDVPQARWWDYLLKGESRTPGSNEATAQENNR